jgi:hypothetical protein
VGKKSGLSCGKDKGKIVKRLRGNPTPPAQRAVGWLVGKRGVPAHNLRHIYRSGDCLGSPCNKMARMHIYYTFSPISYSSASPQTALQIPNIGNEQFQTGNMPGSDQLTSPVPWDFKSMPKTIQCTLLVRYRGPADIELALGRNVKYACGCLSHAVHH